MIMFKPILSAGFFSHGHIAGDFRRRGRSRPDKTSAQHAVQNLTSVFPPGVMKVRGRKSHVARLRHRRAQG
jgi:hypothetical protein